MADVAIYCFLSMYVLGCAHVCVFSCFFFFKPVEIGTLYSVVAVGRTLAHSIHCYT